MQVKTIPPISVLYFSTATTLKEVGQYAYVIAQKLYAEAARQNILPVGPIQWLYHNCNGEPETPFTLEIGLPLQSAPTETSEFGFKELPSFKTVSTLYDGPWDKMYTVYDEVIGWAKTNGYKLTDNFREVYFYMSPNLKLTEINIGIE